MFSESRPDLTQRSITTHQEYPCHVQTYDSYGSVPTNTIHNSSSQNINKSSTLFLDLQEDPFYNNKPSWMNSMPWRRKTKLTPTVPCCSTPLT